MNEYERRNNIELEALYYKPNIKFVWKIYVYIIDMFEYVNMSIVYNSLRDIQPDIIDIWHGYVDIICDGILLSPLKYLWT